MKQRLLSLFAMLSLIVSGAMAQSLTVAGITTEAGQEATIAVAIEGAAEMTALQFNLALPEGFTLAGDIALGSAAKGHTLSTNALASGIPYKISGLAVRGTDLLSLGIKGERVGETLSRLLCAVINGEVANTKDDLINYVREKT